jgi:hypothetical protein
MLLSNNVFSIGRFPSKTTTTSCRPVLTSFSLNSMTFKKHRPTSDEYSRSDSDSGSSSAGIGRLRKMVGSPSPSEGEDPYLYRVHHAANLAVSLDQSIHEESEQDASNTDGSRNEITHPRCRAYQNFHYGRRFFLFKMRYWNHATRPREASTSARSASRTSRYLGVIRSFRRSFGSVPSGRRQAPALSFMSSSSLRKSLLATENPWIKA